MSRNFSNPLTGLLQGLHEFKFAKCFKQCLVNANGNAEHGKC